MHIHILGICGTFMAGIATLAKSLGHQVSGADQHVYPPMSKLLAQAGIDIQEGYAAEHIPVDVDLVIIGNALSRGNAAVEAVLAKRLPYVSGAQWLHDEVLRKRWVLAVAGTHGKTTTASILAWLLESAGLQPGFMVGGVLANFNASARLGDSDFFVIEADEYDTAFFDKRSKFVHYCPTTLIMSNLEFDHADIFPDLEAIQRQFAHLLRVVPGHGQILYPPAEPAIEAVFAQGCWSEKVSVSGAAETTARWSTQLLKADGSHFEVYFDGACRGTVTWDLVGQHNVHNALMAIAAAMHVGVAPEHSCEALADYKNTKRRLEFKGEVNHIRVYDDFAHHPTAIATTLAGLRAKVGTARIIAVLEPRSNTMKAGVHVAQLDASLADADQVFMLQPEGLNWSVTKQVPRARSETSVTQLLEVLKANLTEGDHVLIMSNGGFDNIHQRLLEQLQLQHATES